MKTIDVLRKHESPVKSKWREDAEWGRDNWRWLRYSSAIAISVRQRMKELGITQVALADKLGCTQQHVSMLLKGNANLTLETISKLEEALDFSLIRDSFELVTGYDAIEKHSTSRLLSEAEIQYGKHSKQEK